LQRCSLSWAKLSTLGLLLCLSGCLTDAPNPALRLPNGLDAQSIDSRVLDAESEGDVPMRDRSVLMPDSTVDRPSIPDASPDGSIPEDAGTLPMDALIDASVMPDVQVDMGTPMAPAVLMTELMVLNESNLADEDGDFRPWVEIYNNSYQTVDLAGYQLISEGVAGPSWQCPPIELAPTEYVLVFLSGKDRADPEGQLHANFRLGAMSNYLELRRTADGLGQVMAGWPDQRPNGSYGIPMTVQRHPLFETGDRVRYQVPLDESVDDEWYLPEFVDNHWPNVPTALGRDSNPINYRGTLVADSAEQWSENGAQGFDGWLNGYYDLTNDPNRAYGVDDFIAFPNDGQANGPTNFWDGTRWAFPNGNPPWTLIGRRIVHPNGINNGAEHWPIRRWISRTEGRLIVVWILRKADVGSDGVTGYLMHRGERIDEAAIEGNDEAGFSREVVLENVRIGDPIDFAMGPVGPSGNTEDFQDRSILVGRAWNSHALTSSITTEIDLAGAAGIYLRTQFEVDANPETLTRLRLNVRYDDGFVLYLNGRQVLRRNAPDAVSFDALAPEDRPDDLGLTDEFLALQTQFLQQGTNTMAIHVMNSQFEDGRILMDPVVEWFEVILEMEANIAGMNVPVYRPLPAPTPGTDNMLRVRP